MNIHNLLIPATTYIHTFPQGHPYAAGGPCEQTSEQEIITCIVQPVAFCTVITFAGDEQVLTLSIGYGHSTSATLIRQRADSASEEIQRYEYCNGDVAAEEQILMCNKIASMLTHSEVYKQHKELIDSFVAKYSF